jgi:hypothetical protein
VFSCANNVLFSPSSLPSGIKEYVKQMNIVAYGFDVDCAGPDNCKLKDDFLGEWWVYLFVCFMLLFASLLFFFVSCDERKKKLKTNLYFCLG